MYAGKYEWAADRDSGDCSLRISNAKLDFDDGLWECQVTNSAIDVLDSLTSEPAQLVVRGKLFPMILVNLFDFVTKPHKEKIISLQK